MTDNWHSTVYWLSVGTLNADKTMTAEPMGKRRILELSPYNRALIFLSRSLVSHT